MDSGLKDSIADNHTALVEDSTAVDSIESPALLSDRTPKITHSLIMVQKSYSDIQYKEFINGGNK